MLFVSFEGLLHTILAQHIGTAFVRRMRYGTYQFCFDKISTLLRNKVENNFTVLLTEAISWRRRQLLGSCNCQENATTPSIEGVSLISYQLFDKIWKVHFLFLC